MEIIFINFVVLVVYIFYFQLKYYIFERLCIFVFNSLCGLFALMSTNHCSYKHCMISSNVTDSITVRESILNYFTVYMIRDHQSIRDLIACNIFLRTGNRRNTSGLHFTRPSGLEIPGSHCGVMGIPESHCVVMGIPGSHCVVI